MGRVRPRITNVRGEHVHCLRCRQQQCDRIATIRHRALRTKGGQRCQNLRARGNGHHFRRQLGRQHKMRLMLELEWGQHETHRLLQLLDLGLQDWQRSRLDQR